METKPRILRSIIYAVIGLLFLFLSAKDPSVMIAVSIITGACWLVAVCYWERVLVLPMLLGVTLVFLRTDSLLFSILAVLVIGALVYGSYWCLERRSPLAVSVGVPALCSAVLAVLALAAYLFITRGTIDFSGLLPSLSQIKTTIDEMMYEPLLTAAQSTQMTPAEIDQAITAVLTAKNIYLDALFTVLPGFVMSLLFAVCWLMQRLACLLLGKKEAERLPVEPIRKLKMPRSIGIVFLVAFILTFFVEGTPGAVLNNLVTAFELPLLLCGCFTVYTLFTRRATTKSSKMLTAVLVILTAIGIPISLSVAYVFVGAADSMADLRRRLRGEDQPQEENERMKQWNSFQNIKPNNDTETSEELDVSDDDDEDEGEDQ